MTKPAVSATFSPSSPLALGPAWSLRDGSGASSADDAGLAGPLTLRGSAAWATNGYGPVVRTSAPGDYLDCPDSAPFRSAAAFTAAVAVTPPSFAGTLAGVPSAFLHQQLGFGSANFGIRNVGTVSNPGAVCGLVGGVSTPDAGPVLTAGVAVVLVLRGRAHSPVVLRVYDRATGVQYGADSVSTASLGSAALSATFSPVQVGRLTSGGGTVDQPGDYEFVFLSLSYLDDAQCDALALAPYGNYTAAAAQVLLSGPPTLLPGLPGTFTARLQAGLHPGGTVTVTPATTLGAASPATFPLTDGARSNTFTVTLPMAAAAGTPATVSTANDAGYTHQSLTPTAAYGPVPNLAAFRALLDYPTASPHVYPLGGVALDADDHYDLPFSLASVADYTGNSPDLSAPYATALTRYRDQAVFSDGGGEQGHHVFPRGLRYDTETYGHALSRDALVLLANRASGAQSGAIFPPYYGGDQASSRPNAFNGLAALAAEDLGAAHSPSAEVYAANSLRHVAQWTAAPGARQWNTYVRPFMVGLTCVFLIDYWQRYRGVASTGSGSQGDLASRVPAAVKAACDWLRANCWVDPLPGQPGGFRYTDRDLTGVFNDIPCTVQAGSTPSATAFRGPNSLSGQDGYYVDAYVVFPAPLACAGTAIPSSYDGATRTFHFDYQGGSYAAFPVAPGVGDQFYVTYEGVGTGAAFGDDSGDGSSLNLMVGHAFSFYYWYSVAVLGSRANEYRQWHDDCFLGQYTLFPDTFMSQKLYNEGTFSSLAGLTWRARGDAEWPAATALTLAAPTTAGRVHALSPPLTVALAGGDVSAANPVTATPHDGGAGGTFLPAAVTLTPKPGRPSATFRYRPSGGGARTITVTNDGGLANPAPVTYTPSGTASFATGYTVTAGTPAPPDSPTTLTVALDPPGSVPPTSCDALGGVALVNAFTTDGGYPYAYAGPGATGATAMGNPYVALSGDNPSVALHYLPTTAGTRTLTFRSDGALLTDPSPFALTVVAPTPTPSGRIVLRTAAGTLTVAAGAAPAALVASQFPFLGSALFGQV